MDTNGIIEKTFKNVSYYIEFCKSDVIINYDDEIKRS